MGGKKRTLKNSLTYGHRPWGSGGLSRVGMAGGGEEGCQLREKGIYV